MAFTCTAKRVVIVCGHSGACLCNRAHVMFFCLAASAAAICSAAAAAAAAVAAAAVAVARP